MSAFEKFIGGFILLMGTAFLIFIGSICYSVLSSQCG